VKPTGPKGEAPRRRLGPRAAVEGDRRRLRQGRASHGHPRDPGGAQRPRGHRGEPEDAGDRRVRRVLHRRSRQGPEVACLTGPSSRKRFSEGGGDCPTKRLTA